MSRGAGGYEFDSSISGCYLRDPSKLPEIREEVIGEVRRPLALALTELPEWKPVARGSAMLTVWGACGRGVEVNGKRVPARGGHLATYASLGWGAKWR